MKKILVLLLLVSLSLTLFSCAQNEGDEIKNEIKNEKQMQSNDEAGTDLAFVSNTQNVSVRMADVPLSQEKQEDMGDKATNDEQNEFVMLARITSVNSRIAVEVIESQYATGTYWVVTSSDTLFYDSLGNELTYQDIEVGDTVMLTYTGQVMLSLPPQIIALTIIKQ